MHRTEQVLPICSGATVESGYATPKAFEEEDLEEE
jgi:hypothetical protein